MLIAVPAEHWPAWYEADPSRLAERLLHLTRQVATSKRKPKPKS